MTGLGAALLAALIAGGSAFALAQAPHDARIASTSEAEVCATDGLPGSAYSRAHRVVRRRGVPGHQVDHIVPLCLGGADVQTNIQIEPIEEALRKDELERAVCIAVCRDHRMTLAEGQAIFLGDWRLGGVRR
jgi:hypothetical protein